jgi:hypothetical protein
MDRRAILQVAGALWSASACMVGHRAVAQEAASRTVSGSSWQAGQVSFMLAHEQCTVPHLIERGAVTEQAGFECIAVSDRLRPWQANVDQQASPPRSCVRPPGRTDAHRCHAVPKRFLMRSLADALAGHTSGRFLAVTSDRGDLYAGENAP